MVTNQDTVYPTILDIRIDTFGGPSCGAMFENGKLTYRKGFYAIPVEVNPTPERWKKFWEEIDGIGVWKWNAEYDANLGIIDRTGWSIYIKYGSREIKSHGHHAYPGEINDFEPSEPFKLFLKALDDLLGVQVFEEWLRGC